MEDRRLVNRQETTIDEHAERAADTRFNEDVNNEGLWVDSNGTTVFDAAFSPEGEVNEEFDADDFKRRVMAEMLGQQDPENEETVKILEALLANYKSDYECWDTEDKEKITWEEIKAILCDKNYYYLKQAAKLQHGGAMFGVDKEGNPLFDERGPEGVFKGFSFYEAFDAVYGKDYEPLFDRYIADRKRLKEEGYPKSAEERIAREESGRFIPHSEWDAHQKDYEQRRRNYFGFEMFGYHGSEEIKARAFRGGRQEGGVWIINGKLPCPKLAAADQMGPKYIFNDRDGRPCYGDGQYHLDKKDESKFLCTRRLLRAKKLPDNFEGGQKI